ncbi:MAG TPA: sodium/proline symporter PutP, partial [Methanocorpusculum sp.]|nr:sodium/proline symporter PutP [Methanocorpusculum sp.]
MAFILYFIVMIYIGFIYFKKKQTTKEYVLGDRKLNPFVVAMSAEASDMSGWLLLGLPGLAYATNMSVAGWTAVGLAIGTYLSWKIIARRLRIYSEKANDSQTIPEYFTNRFREKRGLITLISSIFIIVFFVIYTSAQFVAGGKLFSSITTMYFNDISIDSHLIYLIGVIICALIVICYTFTGGFKAVCVTDTIQGLLMLFALLLVPLMAWILLYNGSGSLDMLKIFSPFHEYNAQSGIFEFVSVFTIVSGLAWGFGYFGQPHILPRYMAIKDPNEMHIARNAAMIWVILSLCAAIFVGIIGHIILPPDTHDIDSEKIFIDLASKVFGSLPFIAGVIYCGVLGAIMSTASSQLLVAASAISQDLYKNIINKSATDRHLLNISKVSVLIVSIISITLAMVSSDSVFNIVSHAWAGFGASFGTVILLSLYWKRMNWQSALTGIIVGGLVSLIWGWLLTDLTGIYEMIPGVLCSLISIYIVSKFTKVPEKEVFDMYDEYI